MRKILEFLQRKFAKQLLQQIDGLEKELQDTKKQLREISKPDIEIDLFDDSELNVSPKSVRINAFVWEDWKQFCEYNNEYSKKQLISMALKEFMEKHQ
jgi:hypothetical protein